MIIILLTFTGGFMLGSIMAKQAYEKVLDDILKDLEELKTMVEKYDKDIKD